MYSRRPRETPTTHKSDKMRQERAVMWIIPPVATVLLSALLLNSCVAFPSKVKASFTTTNHQRDSQLLRRRCCLRSYIWKKRQASSLFLLVAQQSNKATSRTLLLVRSGQEDPTRNDSEKNEERKRSIFKIPEVEDPNLIVGDIFALLVVVLLLGFNDAVLDPHFLSNGGFTAPITIPHTLGTSMIRFYQMALAWVVSSLYNRGYSYSAVESDPSALKSSFAIWLSHCSIRIVLALFIALLYHASVDVNDIFKQLWFTLPLMVAFRLLYCRKNSV